MTRESMKTKLLATTLLFGLSGGIWGAAATAQDADADQPVSTVVEEEDGASVQERVVVTGSRLRRLGVDTVRPAIVLDQQVFDDRAFTNVADALNELPSFGPGVDNIGAQNGFSVGQQFVDLFDLGPERTLTLINGRRFVSGTTPVVFGSGTGLAVDINVIPTALIESIDVVPLAGAAVYGTDAIAGTINVTLRDDFEGFEVGGQYRVTEFGDGDEYQLQATWGSNFADGRGNVAGSIEYTDSDGILFSDRPLFTVNNPAFIANELVFGRTLTGLSAGGTASPPDDIFGFGGPLVGAALGIGAINGEILEFQPDGTLAACDPGSPDPASFLFSVGAGPNGPEPTCGFDLTEESATIQSPLERINFTTFGTFDITDNIRIRAEGIISNTEAADELNQGGFNTGIFGDDSESLIFPTTHPLLTNQARGLLEGAGLTTFGVNRFNNDLVSGGIDQSESFAWRSLITLEGDFDFANRNFFWDINGSFGQSDFESLGTGIIQGRFINALDAVVVTQDVLDTAGVGLGDIQGIGGTGTVELGDVICQSVIDTAAGTLTGPSGFNSTVDVSPFVSGCVPLDIFGEGRASPEALAFIQSTDITTSDITQQVYTINFGGDLIKLPGGWVQFSAGYENRTDDSDFIPGTGTSLGVNRSAPFNATGGTIETDEFYGELNIPLVSPDLNIPGIRLAELEGSIRYNDTTTTPGGSFALTNPEATETDNVTFSVGGRYSPVRDLTIRGSYNEAIRTPNVVELFTPQTQIFTFVADPCDEDQINDGPTPAIRQANCASIGITQPFTSNAQDATIIGANSGNPFLVPEEAESWNIGVTFEPRWVDGLLVTADYFNIEIANFIDGVSATDFAIACFDDPNFDVNNPSGACQQIVRDPATNQITFALSGFDNSDVFNFEGVQVSAEYEFDIAEKLGFVMPSVKDRDFGELTWRLNLFRNITTEQSNIGEEPLNVVGSFGTPTVEGTWDTIYQWDKLRLFWRMGFQDAPDFTIGEADDFIDADGNVIELGDVDPIIVHNASATYEIFEGTTVQLAVDNVLGSQGTLLERAFGFTPTSALLGRRFTVRLRAQF